MARVLATTLIGVAAVFVAVGTAAAQQEQQDFAEGVKLYRLGRMDEALQKFQQVLAADPSNQQAFELWKSTDEAVWEALLMDKGEIQQIATHLINLARRGRVAQSRNEDEIRPLVEQATKGADYGARHQAQIKLMSQHGAFAVPDLVKVLGDQDDDAAQINAILALQTIGRDATLPLLAALKSDNDMVRFNVVSALSHIDDERAMPALAALAQNDPNESVRDAASRVVAREGQANRDPVDLYLDQARSDLSSVRERSSVIWDLRDGRLTPIDVPVAVYNYELAKQLAHEALKLQPDNAQARTVLAQAYLGEVASIESSLAANPDDESLQAAGEQIPALKMAVAATGTDTIRRALSNSLSTGMMPMAVAAIDLLGQMETPQQLGDSPLVAALKSDDKRVAYAAALALTQAARGGRLPGNVRAGVVGTLATAVTEEAIRNIKVVDAAPIAQKAVADASFKTGVVNTVDTSATDAIADLYRDPNVDVIVISESLPDSPPEAVIGLVRKDPRFKNTKIVVAAQDPAAAKERFGDRIDGVVQAPLSGDSLREAVDSALKDVPMDQRRARADKVAVAASQALQTLASDGVDVGSALDNLSSQLNRDDAVAIPAARAVGYGGSIGQVPALLDTIERGDASVDLKVAAAQAAGDIFARSGMLDRALFDRLLKVLKSDADAQVRQEVARALGKAKLASDAELELIDALSVEAPGGTTAG